MLIDMLLEKNWQKFTPEFRDSYSIKNGTTTVQLLNCLPTLFKAKKISRECQRKKDLSDRSRANI